MRTPTCRPGTPASCIYQPFCPYTNTCIMFDGCSLHSAFFTKRQINNLILHNPSIFTEKFSAIEEKINFLLREMNVSLHRISRRGPKSSFLQQKNLKVVYIKFWILKITYLNLDFLVNKISYVYECFTCLPKN